MVFTRSGTGEKRTISESVGENDMKNTNTPRNNPLLKLLVPNYVAGALIGKGGSLMTEMRGKCGGNIRLSANRQCYPGTYERIVVLTGATNQIIELNDEIMEKVQSSPSKQPVDESRRSQVKIVLTNAAAGLLIGRGGLTIKSIQEATSAKMSISSIEAATVPGERVLTMSGASDQLREACQQVIEKISGDASNMANTILKYMDGNMGSNTFRDKHLGSELVNVHEMDYLYSGNNLGVISQSLKTKVSIQLEVPNVMVGAILGKSGAVISDFARRSGARFKFSDKDEYAPGTTDRILTITSNNLNQANIAFSLINDRVASLNKLVEV